MNLNCTLLTGIAAAALSVMPTTAALGDAQEVLRLLNDDAQSVKALDENKSYRILFDAYLQLSEPPLEIGDQYNQNTIHPGIAEWAELAGWAESNSAMVEAIIQCKEKFLIGLPYGAENVPPEYRQAGVMADVVSGGNLRENLFPYLDAVDVIAAFATTESYRLLEAGEAEKAMDLAVSHIYVLRQFCDRQFLEEKMYCILMLIDALRNLRDLFYLYQDVIPQEVFEAIAKTEMPYLRPDRSRLFMPEGDKVIAEALLDSVYDERGQYWDVDRFAHTFADIQAEEKPLTRFGAVRRWTQILESGTHANLEDSKDRLNLIYDDWWRRWRVEQYDPILGVPTQFENTNPVRYAAVVFAMEDIEGLFAVRNLLIAEVNGTAVASALCAYKKLHLAYPDDKEKTYSHPLRKFKSDYDPFVINESSVEVQPVFRYRRLSTRQSIDTAAGRIWVEPEEFVLWALGQDHINDWAEQHTSDGSEGDVVLWPPIKAISRQQGLID